MDKCLPREACVMAGNFAEGRTHTCLGKTTPNINCSNSTKACQFHQKFYKHKHTHTHTFTGPLPRTTKVSRYQKGKANLGFSEARDSEWQWHQLGHIQVYTSLQTDNHATPHHSVFYRLDALPTSTEGTQTMKQISKNCHIILKKYITTSIILAFKIHHTIYEVSNTATLASSIFFNK